MFPRARIQRFNDITSDVPPPGAYDPKFDSKVKGVGMDKMTERFVDPKSASHENELQRSSSLSCLPVFRTPQLPKKNVKMTPSSVKQAKADSTSSEKIRRNIEKEINSLEDLKVDRKDHLKHLQDQLQISNKKLQEAEERCKCLENDIAADKDTMDRLALDKLELSQEVDRLIFELSEKNHNLTDLSERYNLLDANLTERKAAVAELEQSRTLLQLELSILKERAAQNAAELDLSLEHCSELTSALSEARALNEELKQAHSSLTADIADLTDRLNEASMQVQARDDHCKTLEYANQDLLILVDEKMLAMVGLEKEMKDLETHSAKLNALLSQSQIETSELRNLNTHLQDRTIDLEQQLECTTCDLQCCQTNCETLKADIAAQVLMIAQLEASQVSLFSELQQVKASFESTQKSLDEAEMCLKNAQTQIIQEKEAKMKYERDVRELSVVCAELQQKLDQRQQLILGLQADLSSSSCELEERRAEAARRAQEYRAEIERICAKHDEELSSVRTDLEKSVADWQARVAQAEAEHELERANLQDLAYKLEQRILEERAAYALLQRESEDSAQIRVKMEGTLADTRAELEAVQERCRVLDEQMSEQRDDLESKLKAAEQALQDEKHKAQDNIAALTRDSEARIAELESTTRKALEEAEINLCVAEAAYTETLRQVHSDTQALLKATKTEAVEELEKMKADSERRVREAQEEVSTISSQLLTVQEELHQVIAVRDSLKSSDLEKQVTIVELQDRVNILEVELAQSQKTLAQDQAALEAVKNELELLKKIRRNLEIIGHETLATVNAVSKRLLESDDEVERLSQMNSVLETNLNEQKESLNILEKDNISQIEDIRTDLLSKVESFKKKCINQNLQLQEQIQCLQESLVMYAKQLEVANENVECLEKDRAEQATVISELQQTANELQATQDFLANQVEDYVLLKKSHKVLRDELAQCKDQLTKARAEAADGEMEIQHREKQIAELSNQLDDVNDKVTELQGVILELETSALERDQVIEQLECKLELQKENAQKANWQISDLSKENEEFREIVDNLNGKLAQQKLDASQQIESLALAKADLQSQIESLNTVLECHKINVLKATERIETLVNVVSAKENQIESMSSEINQLKEHLLSQASQIADLSRVIEDKNEALLSSHQAIDGLINNVKLNENKLKDLGSDLVLESAFRMECELKLTEVLQDKIDAEVLIEDMKDKVLELESEILDKKKLIYTQQTKLDESSKKLEVLKAEAVDSLNQITEAENNIIILKADRSARQADNAVLKDKIADQWSIIEKQATEISSLNCELQNQTMLGKYLEAKLDGNRQEVDKLEENKMALQSEISSLKLQAEMTQWDCEEAVREAKRNSESLESTVESMAEQTRALELELQSEKLVGVQREEALNEEISALKVSLAAKNDEMKSSKELQEQLRAELDQTTRRKETYKAAVVELQQAVKQSRAKMQTLEEDIRAAHKFIAQEQEEHVRKLEEAKEAAVVTNEWERRCHELEALIGPFREQLEAFETERHALEARKEAAEGEVKDLAQRYAQVLGHQNHKQKIHHVLKLKEQILDLKKDNEKLEAQNRSHKRTIDKLKDDLSRFTGHSRFNPTTAFKSHDDSLQHRLSMAQSKSLLDSCNLSKSLRIPSHQSTAKKGKENKTSVDISTPVSSRPSSKVKDELLSPVRHSPVGSPITPLKEVQNQQQVN